ncbi:MULTISPECIES: hypothetical protein [Clostridium]|jgi:hypothetical protein|uniref:Uncharacterized protein n=2 Tax=Clostridium beijerinckii TaxID=1520 RepID=A0A1S8RCZ1_CLOBE|nr:MULTISPECIES: hypothetical protein [Clostridium]ABR34122.1 hypothetical protein Cbei_1952 [Clostridium beijerinckii NCIMB 8052]AIU01433.1 hypothetical protein Cbs_1952 [Clostridium beijerinckii ATCC 35702]MBE6090589.1 hypothetical protein [Clostridium beijerinckii]MBF7811274.1 hypothetical protein [Clostridium beijerinckii]NOW92019.1 hypothetical protein [Clostridium beijerinckii]
MPNIFDGLRKISDNDIIEQIALLETMNVTNISKPIIQKAKKRTISIINFIGSKIGKNRVLEEPEVKEIWALVDEKKEELEKCTRNELNERLFNILSEKANDDLESATEDEVSIEVIEEAAKLYKVHKNLTPNHKADIIYSKYNEKLSGKAKEYINGQAFVDLQETTKDIEEIISSMDEEQKREFTQSVDVAKLTFLNVWKKLDRQHFIRLIWLCVKAYGGRFTVKEEELPSFVTSEEEVEAFKREEELKKSQEELLKLKKQIELCKDKINSIENSLEKEKRLLKNAIRSRDKAEEDIIDLGKIHIKLTSVKKSYEDELKEIKVKMENAPLEELDSLMEEFKVVKFEEIDVNNKISDINIKATYKKELIDDNVKAISIKEESIKNIGMEFQHLKEEAHNLVDAYNKMKSDVRNKEEEKKSEIFKKWSHFFNKFTFNFDNLGNVVSFTRSELLKIEQCLHELHFTNDPMALSMGVIESKGNKKKKEEYEYIDVSFLDGFKIEIQFRILENGEKTVHIDEITPEF